MLKKLLLLAAIAVSAISFAVPSNAASVCVTTDVTVNGTASPANGTTCLP